MAEPGRWRVGFLTQYEQDPLVLYDAGRELGAIVENRVAMQAGLNYTLARRAAIQVLAPVYVNSGTQTPNFSADGAGMGDLSLGGRFQLLKVGPFSAGLRANLTAPTGRKDAYMGEASLRTGGALLGKADFGRVELLVDAGGMARSTLETEEDVTFASELIINSGVRVEPVAERLWLFGGALTRGGVGNLWQPESGENPAELIAGAQLNVARDWQFDAGAGTGLTDGYGTTQQRLFVGVTWQQPPPPPKPPPLPVRPPEAERPVYEFTEEPPEEIVFEDGVGLDIIKEQIVLEEPIKFEFNTPNILPESLPVLQGVAGILQRHPDIGQVIIEGHASDEGSFEYNYALSLTRAVAIWEALLDEGVHPQRLAVRGMSESVSVAGGLNEGELAKERRVEFHIVQWLDEFGDPTLDPDIPHPITGDQGVFRLPQPRVPDVVSPEPERIEEGIFDEEDEPLDLELFEDE